MFVDTALARFMPSAMFIASLFAILNQQGHACENGAFLLTCVANSLKGSQSY